MVGVNGLFVNKSFPVDELFGTKPLDNIHQSYWNQDHGNVVVYTFSYTKLTLLFFFDHKN